MWLSAFSGKCKVMRLVKSTINVEFLKIFSLKFLGLAHAHHSHPGYTFIVKVGVVLYPEVRKSIMAASSVPTEPDQNVETSLSNSVPFDFGRPPIIEGFSPLPRVKDETFKEKFIRKSKENPFVPIGQLHKLRKAVKFSPSLKCCQRWQQLLTTRETGTILQLWAAVVWQDPRIAWPLCRFLQVAWEQQELSCTGSVPSIREKPDSPSCWWEDASLLRASLWSPLSSVCLPQRWSPNSEDSHGPGPPCRSHLTFQTSCILYRTPSYLKRYLLLLLAVFCQKSKDYVYPSFRLEGKSR